MQEIFIRHEKSGKLLILMSESTTPRNRVDIQMTMAKGTRTTLETVPAVARAGLSGIKAVNRMRMMMMTTNMLQTIHLLGQAQGSKVVKCIQTTMKGTRTTLEEVSAVVRAGLSGSKAVNRMRTRTMTLDGGVATVAVALADHCGSVHMRTGTRTTLEKVPAVARAGLSGSKAVNRLRTRTMTLDGGVATLAAALADHCGSVHMMKGTRTTLEKVPAVVRAGLSGSKAVNRMRMMMMQMRDILDDAMIIVIILKIGGQLMTLYL